MQGSPGAEMLGRGGGGCSGGPRGDTLRSTSDGQMELPWASPHRSGAWRVSWAPPLRLPALEQLRGYLITWKFRHLAVFPRVSEDREPLLWPRSG